MIYRAQNIFAEFFQKRSCLNIRVLLALGSGWYVRDKAGSFRVLQALAYWQGAHNELLQQCKGLSRGDHHFLILPEAGLQTPRGTRPEKEIHPMHHRYIGGLNDSTRRDRARDQRP